MGRGANKKKYADIKRRKPLDLIVIIVGFTVRSVLVFTTVSP